VRGGSAWNALAGRPLRDPAESSVLLATGLGSLLECERTDDAPARDERGRPIAVERPFACRRPRLQLVASTVSGQLNAIEPEVVGLNDGGSKELDVKYLQLPLALGQRLLDTRDLSMFVLLLREPEHAARFARELSEAARARGLALTAMPWQEHTSGVEHRRGVQILNVFRALMGSVVVLIAGMTVLTTMAKAVSERTREIGTLRSLGFLRRQIVLLFALEAALLAAVACAFGLALTVGVTAAANASGVLYDGGIFAQPVRLTIAYLPWTWAGTAALLSLVAGLAAVIPARRASRARIPDALSHA
jgi:putative ABC transport system permease protein